MYFSFLGVRKFGTINVIFSTCSAFTNLFFFSDEKEEYLSFKKKKEKDQFKFPFHSPAKEKKTHMIKCHPAMNTPTPQT